MKKVKIACDICNTLADVNGELEKRGFVREEGTYFIEGLGADYFTNNLDVFENATPFEGAAERLRAFVKNGFEIVYLTARPKKAKKVTREWLKKNGFPKGKIVFSNNKPEDFKRLHCTYAIDDAPHEIKNYQVNNIKVLIHLRDYNLSFGDGFSWNF